MPRTPSRVRLPVEPALFAFSKTVHGKELVKSSLVPFTLASKNPNLSRIRVFSVESKNPPPQRDFFETPPKFHWLFANVNARSNLAGIIRVFGHVVRDLSAESPRPRARNIIMRILHVYGQR